MDSDDSDDSDGYVVEKVLRKRFMNRQVSSIKPYKIVKISLKKLNDKQLLSFVHCSRNIF